MITALDVAQTLEDLGFEVLGPTGRVASALGIIDSATVGCRCAGRQSRQGGQLSHCRPV